MGRRLTRRTGDSLWNAGGRIGISSASSSRPRTATGLADLRAFTRDVMRQMEDDLGMKLDWVAVDHFNTGYPHSHVVIRGKDDAGKDLIIAQDYITDGVRLRAQERATLELGPETDLELRAKLQAEVSAERFTRIDRAMLEEAPDCVLDLRPEAGQVHAVFDRTLRIAACRHWNITAWRRRRSPACGVVRKIGADAARIGRAR
jgi:type IV secretory pathway VirD2 relaxase